MKTSTGAEQEDLFDAIAYLIGQAQEAADGGEEL